MKTAKILKKPEAPEQTVMVNVRMKKSVKAAFTAKLTKDGYSQQEFWDQVVSAYLEGKLT